MKHWKKSTDKSVQSNRVGKGIFLSCDYTCLCTYHGTLPYSHFVNKIWSPHYYGHFILAQTKAQSVISLFKELL